MLRNFTGLARVGSPPGWPRNCCDIALRLTSIKLAGFKSFVDPTHFQVPGQRVGVVGPNGCGKSNIIDAVRWVLGESRASELRGESMQDVIFNGSTNRKPGSRASVELVFDNATKRAGGQWGSYDEIAVKRVLTRDGTSSYYINNLPARRRDIQDIFLGTGLGPRAYAIIGQGMIARLIEAKPEELRVFLEEAAGVSKYKERRRETENRLSDTRENLLRVEDILRELSGNLDKLESQAEVAQRFTALRDEGEEKQRLLWLIRRNEARAAEARHRQARDEAALQLDMRTAELRDIETELEQLRAAHYAAGDAMQQEQSRLYEANAEVARLEAEIRFVTESRQRLQTQIGALGAQAERWRQQAAEADVDRRGLGEAREIAEEKRAIAAEEAAMAAEALPALEADARERQQRLTALRGEIAQVEQELKLNAAAARAAQAQLQQLEQRRLRLQAEQQGLSASDNARLDALREDHETAVAIAEEARLRLMQADDALPQCEAAWREREAQAGASGARLQQLEARQAALQSLQASLQRDGTLAPWLEKHGLDAMPSLWQRVRVESGWETALEAALREALAAREVRRLDSVAGFAADPPPARLVFFAAEDGAAPAPQALAGLRPALSLLTLDDAAVRAVLGEWLGDTWVADSLDEALARRAQLPRGGRIVVAAGHVVTPLGVRFHAADSEQAGMLAREQAIADLAREIQALQGDVEASREQAVRAERLYRDALEAQAAVRREADQAERQAHARQIELLTATEAARRSDERRAQLDADLGEIALSEEEQRAVHAESEARFESNDQVLAERQQALSGAESEFERFAESLDRARAQLRERERLAQEADFEARKLAQRDAELQRNLEMYGQQLEQVEIDLETARAEQMQLEDSSVDNGLQAALALRVEREASLGAARRELDQLTQRLRQADESRLAQERALQPLRERITECQLQEQAARLSAEQFAEQLEAVGADLESLSTRLAPELKPAWLQAEVTRINAAIQALGPVNMAALDELGEARERKQFLDAQSEDLRTAIETLEGAIRTIDEETRELLQSTFDEVNRHFGELFPRLFGGGQARLIMTGDEILDAGVQVMAQPPGKKNSTIHLLSGGEKALTATALVFAMFQLNPAPFCLLDEVDAPLDDANTDRFAKLVTAMSDKTQFLFISHNRIAMEMAEQLIGVTMQEQGVSRIVAVDMEAAAGFVQGGG